MTTPQAEALYAAQHMGKWGDAGWASFNPNETPLKELPKIYGFNNGGSAGWYSGVILAEDGTSLGGHICSHECYMPHDLGVLEGARPDRHADFQKHYPNGYRMYFVKGEDVLSHEGLADAFKRNQTKDTASGAA